MSVVSEKLVRFLDGEGRLTAYPAKRKMKLYALIYLAEKIEPNLVYTEKEINMLLSQWHVFSDPATLRRELYIWKFIDRSIDCRSYTRADILPTLQELGLEE